MSIFRQNYIIYHISFGYGIIKYAHFLDGDEEIAVYFNKDKKKRYFSKNALVNRIDTSKSKSLTLNDVVDLYFVDEIFENVNHNQVEELLKSAVVKDFVFDDKHVSGYINEQYGEISIDEGMINYQGDELHCYALFDLLMHSLETTFDKEQEQILSLVKEVDKAEENYPLLGLELINKALENVEDFISVITNKGVLEKYQRGLKPLIMNDEFIEKLKEFDEVKSIEIINKHKEAKLLVSDVEKDIGVNKINTIPYHFFNHNYYLVIKDFERENSDDHLPFVLEAIRRWNNDERVLVQLLNNNRNEAIILETAKELKNETSKTLFVINHASLLKKNGFEIGNINYDNFVDCLNKSDPLNRLDIVINNYEIFIKNGKEIELLQEICKSNDGFYISQTKKCILAIEAMPHNIEIFKLFANNNFEFFNRYQKEKEND